MKTPSWFVASIAGAHFATTLILACGADDSPTDARTDGGTCDCPAAEPPLAGRIVRVSATVSVVPGGPSSVGNLCPTGSALLGGGCKLADNVSDPTYHLINAGSNGNQSGFVCTWPNNGAATRDGIAEAFCLVPPQ